MMLLYWSGLFVDVAAGIQVIGCVDVAARASAGHSTQLQLDICTVEVGGKRF